MEYSNDIWNLALANMTKVRAREFRPVLANYNHCCAVCGESNPFQLQLDHVHPTSKGGEDEPSNWQVLCGPCNNVKNNIEGMERIPARNPSKDEADKVAAHVAFRLACQAKRRK
jgi:5-methylcytosine-specific restriction endonuclease McrA